MRRDLAVERDLDALDLDDEVAGSLGHHSHLRALDEAPRPRTFAMVPVSPPFRNESGICWQAMPGADPASVRPTVPCMLATVALSMVTPIELASCNKSIL